MSKRTQVPAEGTDHAYRRFQWIVLWIIFTVATVSTLPAYDCEHAKARFVEIDLLEPQECPDPDTDYTDSDVTYVQVLHIDSMVTIPIHSCKVIYTKEVTRCGWQSINFGSQYSAYRENYELTPDECRIAL